MAGLSSESESKRLIAFHHVHSILMIELLLVLPHF